MTVPPALGIVLVFLLAVVVSASVSIAVVLEHLSRVRERVSRLEQRVAALEDGHELELVELEDLGRWRG